MGKNHSSDLYSYNIHIYVIMDGSSTKHEQAYGASLI